MLASCAIQPDSAPKNHATTAEGLLVEKAILWNGELDEGWNPVEMKRLLEDEERFEKQGTQYLCLKPMVVFGHRSAYVGMLGIGSVAGPNATLAGTPKSIASYISKEYGAEFQLKKGVYLCDYKPNIRLLIEKDPQLEGASLIIGAYVGPR